MAEMNTKINQLKEYKKKTKSTLQPLIFAIMPEHLNFTQFIVYFPEVYYEFNDLLEAVTFCFICHHEPLNLEYNAECILIWRFLEKYFFEISPKPEEQWEHSDINNLIDLL